MAELLNPLARLIERDLIELRDSEVFEDSVGLVAAVISLLAMAQRAFF